MQPLTRRDAWLLQADAETPDMVALTLRDAPLRTVPAAAVTASPRRLPRRRPLVVSRQVLRDASTADALARLAIGGARLLQPRDYYERTLRRVMLEDLDEPWFLFDHCLRRRPIYTSFKTVVDIVAGLVGSLLAVLLALLLWVYHRFEDHGPVFYRQERVGLHDRPFRIWKFRTMRMDAEAEGPVWAAVDDDRVTRLGRLLRSTHLDELPQFFNVLRWEMSLVGPRPERPVFVHRLGRAVPFFDRRHLVRPGVTGWAVVRFGYSDSVRDKWIIHEYDLYYLKHRSALLDLEIAARTLLVMLTRRGQ
jgi:lipopolysaccharide/colanic/teichoic acid biosynthesis glycosyltransferase